MLLLFEVDASKVDAKFKKGVLKITLPKPAEVVAKTKRIKINSAA